MIHPSEWLALARKLDWRLGAVEPRAAFPDEVSGEPWLDGEAWLDWDEPFRTTCADYVATQHDKDAAIHAVWRSWLLFAIVTGFAMDYRTPLEARERSFKEFMEEWVLEQFARSSDEYGLKKPWCSRTFLASLDTYHHMVYASAYTCRATVWFDFVVPGPRERGWVDHDGQRYTFSRRRAAGSSSASPIATRPTGTWWRASSPARRRETSSPCCASTLA